MHEKRYRFADLVTNDFGDLSVIKGFRIDDSVCAGMNYLFMCTSASYISFRLIFGSRRSSSESALLLK